MKSMWKNGIASHNSCTVDPKAQKPAQQRALHDFLTQNAGVKIMAIDKSNQEKFLFNGIILNIENDDTGNVTGYNVKRKICYTLTKNLPKRKAMIESTGGQKQYPMYEGEEEPSSDDEPYLNEDDVIIRRKKKYIPWQGLERGISHSFNTAEDGDKALWNKYDFPRQISLGAESSLSQLNAHI